MNQAAPQAKKPRSTQRRASDDVVAQALDKLVEKTVNRMGEFEVGLKVMERRQDVMEDEFRVLKGEISSNTSTLNKVGDKVDKILSREDKRRTWLKRGDSFLRISGVILILWILFGGEKLQAVLDLTKLKVPVEAAK